MTTDDNYEEDDEGVGALRRLAVAYFSSRIDNFLAMRPEDIQKLCHLAEVGESEFVSACQVLMAMRTDPSAEVVSLDDYRRLRKLLQ